MTANDLVHLNALLNAASVVCLTIGYRHIWAGDRRRHKAAMISALGISAAFLVSYVIYKLNAGFARFGGEGWVRPVYFTILAVHVAGAIALVPLVPTLVFRALTEKFDKHRKLARYVWPLWMYVGISGVVVYILAVHVFPYTGA